MSDVINVNISDAAVEICCQDGAVFDVLWQDEVNLNLDLNLMYIKSGQAEIQSYVNNVSKPEIDAYLNTQAEPIVADVSSRIVTPLIDNYVTETSKPELDAFVEAKKPELQAYVSSAQEQANLATEQAEAAVAAKNESVSLAENAQASASAAEQSSLSAAVAQNNAAASAAQALEFAEQASSASGGKANVDLDNLSSVGIAKFNAKQNTITGAATTIASANLTANRALISNGSGKIAVSAVTSTELGYLDGVTSAIQTQLNSKQAAGSYANTSLSNISTSGLSSKYFYIGKLLVQWGIAGRTQQGGTVWVGFPKPFANTAYGVSLVGKPDDSENWTNRVMTVNKTLSTTGFTITNNGWSDAYNGMTALWIAVGQGV